VKEKVAFARVEKIAALVTGARTCRSRGERGGMGKGKQGEGN
jgi:hypothetical protein